MAKGKIEAFKREGKKVGVCHGAFDLVHPGHVKHFESASKLCDVLIVSLTSDHYISKRKGFNRPIYCQDLRAYIIASLRFVDFVTISNFKTGKETIEYLKPNFYIKGPDYRNKETNGIKSERNAIQSVGGEMLYTNDEKFSTSKLIDKIKRIQRKKMLLILDRDGTLVKDVGYLGKEKNFKENVVFNRAVIDIIHYLARFFSMINIVISNQAGVGWKYFTERRVKEVNNYIDIELKKEGIEVAKWKYSPYVDKEYANKKGLDNFDINYVKPKTKRKPSPEMVYDFLKKEDLSLDNFDEVLVLGDKEDDEKLAKNLGSNFINVKDKDYYQIKYIIDFIIK